MKKTKKKLESITVLFRCSGHEQDVANWAYYIVNKETAETLLEEMRVFNIARAVAEELTSYAPEEMTFYGGVNFINALPKRLQRYEALLEDSGGGYFELNLQKSDIMVADAEDARMEIAREHINECGVYWSAGIKHTNDIAETPKVEWTKVQEWLRRLT